MQLFRGRWELTESGSVNFKYIEHFSVLLAGVKNMYIDGYLGYELIGEYWGVHLARKTNNLQFTFIEMDEIERRELKSKLFSWE